MKQYYVYILASSKNGTLFIGVTGDLIKRIHEHKQDLIESFTRKYKVYQLVYYEVNNEIGEAIAQEKQIKNWNRKWKIRLIEEHNYCWRDLYNDIIQYQAVVNKALDSRLRGNDKMRAEMTKKRGGMTSKPLQHLRHCVTPSSARQ